MRLGFLAVVPLLMLALCGCTQSPDWIASTSLALDGGGVGGGGTGGGMSGTGGMGGGGIGGMGGAGGVPNDAGAIDCNPRLDRALLLFLPLVSDDDRDGDGFGDRCMYNLISLADAELRVLLEELIYSMDPEEPNPEVVPPDRYCNEINWPWRPLIGDSFDPENPLKVLICPRFCVALRDWVAKRSVIELQCMAGAP
jgi:hypothetical protein